MAKEKDNKKAKTDAKTDAKADAKANGKENGKATDKTGKAPETKAEACYKSLKNYVPKKKQGYLKAALNHATDKNLEAIKKMKKKSPGTTRFFAIFGFLGLDRFYLGDILRAITKILATAIIALTICARFLPYFKDEVPNRVAIAPQAPATAQEGLDLEDGYNSFIGVWTNQTGEKTFNIHKTGVYAEVTGEDQNQAYTVTTAKEENVNVLYLTSVESTPKYIRLAIKDGKINIEYVDGIPEPPPLQEGDEGDGGEGESVSFVVPLVDGDTEDGNLTTDDSEGNDENTPPPPPANPLIFEKQYDEQGTTVYRAGIPEWIATIILAGVAAFFGLYIILDIFLSPKKARKDNYYRILEIINPAPKEDK